MKPRIVPFIIGVVGVVVLTGYAPLIPSGSEKYLGLPPIPAKVGNPQTPEKIALGKKLFNDMRFSSTGEVSCATCHAEAKAFTDGPLSVSEGINQLTGTRNAPTVVNSVFFTSLFWDGRSPDLEDQALHPFTNPIEMGLASHEPILEVIRKDEAYITAFKKVFKKSAKKITIQDVTKAIAAFERTIVFGNSPFDRWFYGAEKDALTDQQKRGYELFTVEARCVSCHVIEQTQGLFTDNRFHNIGVGINNIQNDIPSLAQEFLKAEMSMTEVDIEVLSDSRTSELGRFAVTRDFDDIGSFKTSILRNIALTGPYMHDGSIKTLREVVQHYNNGGVTDEGNPVNDFLSGGIRKLNLTDSQINDIVAFMEALTSPEVMKMVGKK